MIPYHGLPVTPETAAVHAVQAGHAFVSFAHPVQLPVAAAVCQSFALDNGAFPAWARNKPITDWSPFYRWADECLRIPSCDFAVVPDVIDGDESANDALLNEWPFARTVGAPVWHMHESLDRLKRLADGGWNRVCLGSSGEFKTVGSASWWARMRQAMDVLCDGAGRPRVRLHGLRMLNPKVFSVLPFASADSTNIGRNVGIDKRWNGTYAPATKEARALAIRLRIEAFNAPTVWVSERAPYHSTEDQLW